MHTSKYRSTIPRSATAESKKDTSTAALKATEVLAMTVEDDKGTTRSQQLDRGTS